MQKQWNQRQTLHFWAPKSLQMVTAAMKLKSLDPWKDHYDPPRRYIKKQRHHFANKGPSIQSYNFSSNHVWMWELDHEKSWAPKNWCFWTVVLQKTLESSLDFKESKPVHPKGNKSWIYIGHIDAEAPILRPPDMKSWFIWKGILGKIEGRRKGWQRMRWMDGNTDSRDMGFSKLQEWWTGKPGVLQSMGLQRIRTRLSNWTVLHAWYAFWPVICLSCTLE